MIPTFESIMEGYIQNNTCSTFSKPESVVFPVFPSVNNPHAVLRLYKIKDFPTIEGSKRIYFCPCTPKGIEIPKTPENVPNSSVESIREELIKRFGAPENLEVKMFRAKTRFLPSIFLSNLWNEGLHGTQIGDYIAFLESIDRTNLAAIVRQHLKKSCHYNTEGTCSNPQIFK